MILLPEGLRTFQDNAVSYLVDETTNTSENQTITMKSPTGSGKTIILIAFIDRYLEFMPNDNTAFVWLTPGSGELEQQREKMEKLAPHLQTMDIQGVLNDGFSEGTTSFINWEQVTNKNNRSITENERKNLFEQIAIAHRNGMNFIVIIDEEHSHNTAKAQDIINAFSAKATIRVSATATKNPRFKWYEIKEQEVIQSGLIKKAMYINEGLSIDNETVDLASESEVLLKLADKKRKEIQQEYESLGKGNIRPLVLIQFPSESESQIQLVEKQLSDMGYTYDNKMVAKWMADASDKINLKGIEKNDGDPSFLLIKQAVVTGWDCPRSHILVKLRENMEKNFEIQTIGRIRRMPESKHYDVENLDCCYLYTFDEEYKESIIDNVASSYEVKKLYLKSQYKSFQLPKQNRDLDYDSVGLADIYNMVYSYFVDTYKLGKDKEKNKDILERYGYKMDNHILGKIRKGRFITYSELLDNDEGTYQRLSYTVDTHIHGIDMMHSIDMVKKVIKMSHENTRAMLLSLFSKQVRKKKKILSLNKKEWYAFIINNAEKIRNDFRTLVSTGLTYQMKSIEINPKVSTFTLPEEDFFKYDSTNLYIEEYLTNAYSDYTSQMTISGLRSTSEQLFELYCERNDSVEWVYKNGDTGQQYLSIVYLDRINNQWLFYPDYIVKLKSGDVWIIETKGGEVQGRSKNIDERSGIKFTAFKNYAEKHNLNWGFVRDKDQNLFLNNTVYTEDMNNQYWKALKDIF